MDFAKEWFKSIFFKRLLYQIIYYFNVIKSMFGLRTMRSFKESEYLERQSLVRLQAPKSNEICL